MTALAVGGDVLKWHAHARVQKYSDDQVAWASRASGLIEPPGAFLQRHCGEPEDGYAEADGNLLVTVGLDAITKLLTAIGGAQAFSGPTRAIVGVGDQSTTAVIGDTHLGGDGANAWYQGCDSSNPTQANGVITCVCTFTTSNGNFAWNEWGWATCTGSITPGATLASVATGSKLWNHKIQSLGTKSSGSWVLTSTVTIA
jgi:hypothetical protein